MILNYIVLQGGTTERNEVKGTWDLCFISYSFLDSQNISVISK